MQLSSLLQTISSAALSKMESDPNIASIHCRSQNVKPEGIFVAIPGLKSDGHDYIEDAVSRGANAVVIQRPVSNSCPAVQIQVENTRAALASLAAQFYNKPSNQLHLIGITGTNGKTTIAYFIENILIQAGLQAGVISTIDYRYKGKSFPNPLTTPESLDLQKILRTMLNEGVTHVVMEVSSHALDMDRVTGCHFDIGVFSNLSQDHLDYHKTMANYWACKKRLFNGYLNEGPKKNHAMAVVNNDDPCGRQLAENLTLPVLCTSIKNHSNIYAKNISVSLNGLSAEVNTPNGSFDLTTQMVGRHNLSNILNAAGVGLAMGISLENIKAGIENTMSIPGRLERIENSIGRSVFVDYAHTPDALKNVLMALRNISNKRIICVFGCGGDRDKTKRHLMGEIAARLSDLAIITSDNPRTEDPMKIIEDTLRGVRRLSGHIYNKNNLINGFNQKGYAIEPDRKSAIKMAVSASQPGDAVLIAGKGHEDYQIIGSKTIHFDDREEALKILSAVNILS
ncbi:UDP-N-acetylmuramoyl-L-alanyl-D-glutamate--2, 6-diaminopimelate ligase [Candidatus Magnetomoraceae bacterium gMMP-15]